MELSIIIVNYNTKKLTRQTIDSIINTTQNGEALNYEIIVSDNCSQDGSIEMLKENYRQVMLIENKDNLGFGKANNIAIKRATGRYILLLNSDTVVIKECLQKCVRYMDAEKSIGALGCKVKLENGKLDHACKRGFPTPNASLFYMLKLHKIFPGKKQFGGYTLEYLNENQINEVDSLTGAFMMVRKEAIDKVGLLDEDFFMYGEDIDWCYRIKEAGFKIIYFPEAEIIHYKGGSSKKKRLKTIYEFYRAMYLFYKKHYYNKYNIFITASVYGGIGFKFLLSVLINLLKKRKG